MQIELNNLVRVYDSADGLSKVAAVNDISLTIPSNQIFGIIGKSGAGKSSLVRFSRTSIFFLHVQLVKILRIQWKFVVFQKMK